MATLMHLPSNPYIILLCHHVTPMTHDCLRGPPPWFLVGLGIPKPMIPYPLLGQGVVRSVGSHLGRIPSCSEVPNPPPPLLGGGQKPIA